MNQLGKKGKEWAKIRARLKKKFAAWGITRCELNLENCSRDDYLGFAHGRKRRNLKDGELESLVILACNGCHQIIERLPAPSMLATVQNIIRLRTNRENYDHTSICRYCGESL